jgi:hypothetical protein
MRNFFKQWRGIITRRDVLCAAVLTLVVVLMWCTIYDRWTLESWQTPLTYLSDPEKGDVISLFAMTRAARDEDVSFFHFTNVPELGAPHVANWDDYPAAEKPLFQLLGLLARVFGIFAAVNLADVLEMVLAALSFYAAGRLLNCSWWWSAAGALVFALSRYGFAHGIHHLAVAYYWHVPLCLVVCQWMFRGTGIRVGERRFWFALIIAFLTGVQNVYYTYLFMQLVLFGGLLQAWKRGWREVWPTVAIAGTSALAFFLMDLNTILYHLVNGGNEKAVERSYKWMEIFGLKLVDLVVPPPDHAFPPFAAWGVNHGAEVLLSPGEMPPAAYLGLLGLGALGWLVAISLRRAANRSGLPLEAFFVLWILLFACVGGINSIMGAMGFQLFRTATRYSIFILAIVLLYGAQKLSGLRFRKQSIAYGLGALLVLIAWWDQAPPRVTDLELADTQAQVASDREFTEKMEQALPDGAMVFQTPIMDFPESPAPGVTSYDHFRPFLYSRDLRFSFGSDKGRPDGDWQHQFTQLSLPEVVAQLESAGFSAIYVNRSGFANQGADLVKAFQSAGLTDIINSERGDLFCVVLRKR